MKITILGFVMAATMLCQSAGNSANPVSQEKPAAEGGVMRFGLSGKMGVKPGQRDAVVAILLRDVDKMKVAGCHLYVVSVSPAHPDDVFIMEVWESREAHRASLQLPSVKQAIAEARPMLSGKFEHVELEVAGGLGVPRQAQR